MKKLLILLAFIPVCISAQTIKSKISQGKFGTIDAEFIREVENGDTSYFVACSFQNAEYSAITDIGMIFITDQLTLDSLTADLEAIIKYVGTKTEISYKRKSYSLVHYDFNPAQIYVEDEDGKYTRINAKNAEKLVLWLKSVKFPK